MSDVELDSDLAELAEIAAGFRRMIGQARGRHLSDAERAALGVVVANLRRLNAQIRFLIHDDPGQAMRAVLGDLAPPTGGAGEHH